jgi:hypothetical protein
MFKIIALIAFILFLVIIGPFLTLWALNTIFPALAIPYTLETWAASLLLFGLTRTTISKDK